MTTNQILSIIDEHDIHSEFINSLIDIDPSTSIKDALTSFYTDVILFEYADDYEPVYALMEHTGDNCDECHKAIDRYDYLVLTDYEADNKWDEYLENLLDDCILPDLPETARNYFDRESWIEDAKYDGRGHSLSSYDGSEYDEEINGTTYYIYRQN